MAIHEDLSRVHDVKAASNRSLGFVFTLALTVIGAWPLLSGAPVRWWALLLAPLCLAVALAAPGLLTIPNRLWTRFGMLLHRVLSPVVLGVMFFVVVTPLGILMRALGKDSMRLRHDDGAESYWVTRDPPGPEPSSLDHQF
jgi:hypothetical protein